MIAVISSGDWEELQRLLNEQQAEEQAAQPKQHFTHKEPPPFRCSLCQLAARVGERMVCQATARTVSKDDYPAVCAFLPRERPADD